MLKHRFLNAGVLILDSGERQVTLLELYTSQGCSSCPPAERWLHGYLGDDGLWTAMVPAVFHVDYWDGLGWRDTLASPAHGELNDGHLQRGCSIF